jgi:hypothetical protein
MNFIYCRENASRAGREGKKTTQKKKKQKAEAAANTNPPWAGDLRNNNPLPPPPPPTASVPHLHAKGGSLHLLLRAFRLAAVLPPFASSGAPLAAEGGA